MERDDLNHSRNEEGALWSIVGYLLSGLIIWGGIGWGFDQWLGTNSVSYTHLTLPTKRIV